MVACSLQANQHLLDVYPCLLGPAASLSASLFRPAAIRHAERRQDLSGVYLILFINNQPTVSAVSRACLLTATPAEFEVENTKIPRSFLSTVTLPPWKLFAGASLEFLRFILSDKSLQLYSKLSRALSTKKRWLWRSQNRHQFLTIRAV